MQTTNRQSASPLGAAPKKRASLGRYWWAIAAGVLLQTACLFLVLWVPAGAAHFFDDFFQQDMAAMERPQIAELAGTYRLTNQSASSLRSWTHWNKRYRSVPSSTIELRADGTVAIVNMPDCAVTGWDESNGEFLSGEGSWRVSEEGMGYYLEVDTSRGPNSGSISPWTRIRGFEKPYYLQMIIGDPDNGDTIDYVRD
jgi:hypothetical protein